MALFGSCLEGITLIFKSDCSGFNSEILDSKSSFKSSASSTVKTEPSEFLRILYDEIDILMVLLNIENDRENLLSID